MTGELSGFKRHHPSGHLYFDLKDPQGRISCVQWRDSARRLRFEPADGMEVRAHGRLGIYEVQGRLQLYVDALEPSGLGELQAALERLKARLAAEGLFDPARKRPIPPYPERIGVATSATGAAVRDILRVLGERWPVAEVILRPCPVQGEGAAEQIAEAITDLEVLMLDLILLARGGGSIEDLWAFNEEIVVRAVAGCRVPVITGIGHEIDFTLADFASDHRAATPSQAAEISVPAKGEILRLLRSHAARLHRRAESRVRDGGLRLSRLEGSHGLHRPLDLVRRRSQRVDDLSALLDRAWAVQSERRMRKLHDLAVRWKARHPVSQLKVSRVRLREFGVRLERGALRTLRDARERLQTRTKHLEAVGPEAVLSRGYAICLRARDRNAVRAWDEVAGGEQVQVILGKGSLSCTVDERREEWG